MAGDVPNRVRVLREARGLSQVALATAVGLSRQSVGAIEAGRSTPAVDVALRIAAALDCEVEALFGSGGETMVAEPLSAGVGEGRVTVAEVAGRWVAYPLTGGVGSRTHADGLAGRARGGRREVEALRPRAELAENVVMMGCAPALGVMADRLNASAGPGRFVWVPSSSTGALEALSTRKTHVGGVHLVDGPSGEANVVDARRYAADALVLITLARWEAGLVIAKGNPARIRGAADLGRPGLRLVARERGSGARRLLERELTSAGLPSTLASGASLSARGHLEVAHAVSLGAADVGVATRDAAIGFELDFVPLAEERYDLAIPLAGMADPRLRRLLDVLTSAVFRRELSSLGYDTASSGQRAAEIPAA